MIVTLSGPEKEDRLQVIKTLAAEADSSIADTLPIEWRPGISATLTSALASLKPEGLTKSRQTAKRWTGSGIPLGAPTLEISHSTLVASSYSLVAGASTRSSARKPMVSDWRGVISVTVEEMFGYPCQECGKGTMRTTIFPKYKTAVDGNPFTVDNAIIGVCDRCGNQDFLHTELERWEKVYEELHAGDFMSPEEIGSLRAKLALSAIDFARLLGTTRQSVHNWESPRRKFHQSRMADSLLRLVSDSIENRQMDVLDFLCARAAVFGSDLRKKVSKARKAAALFLLVKKVSPHDGGDLPIATPGDAVASAPGDAIGESAAGYDAYLLYDKISKRDCGALNYDTLSATVNMVLWSPWHGLFSAELRMGDGWQPVQKVQVKDGKATLLQGAPAGLLSDIRELKLIRLD